MAPQKAGVAGSLVSSALGGDIWECSRAGDRASFGLQFITATLETDRKQDEAELERFLGPRGRSCVLLSRPRQLSATP